MKTSVDYIPYDYTGWQARMQFTTAQAASALGVSISFFSQLRRDGGGRGVYGWACYGMECAEQAKRARI